MTLQENETIIRLSVFAGVFLVLVGVEFLAPRRALVVSRWRRWVSNGALVVLDTLALRVVVPVLAVGMAGVAAREGWGLFNLTPFPFWMECVAAVILLDAAIYGQHVAFHKAPLLWRFHKVHHADRDIDVTTGVRFHPVEIILSMVYKLACVIVLGAPALAVFVFEVALNASSMFNHANIKLPSRLDNLLRSIIVTPDMHRVHHSVIRRETDSNFGFFLSVWDRFFGTYISQPSKGHEEMTIGLSEHQDEQPSQLMPSLLMPFLSTRHRD